MPDETKPKDLETVLARLQNEWRELADLLTTQGKSQDRIIEVEQILLRDASGQYRGKISANPDGSADLLLGDRAGKAWARLGVNQDGEAFLELKDQHGESSYKASGGRPLPRGFPGAGRHSRRWSECRFPPAPPARRGRSRPAGRIGPCFSPPHPGLCASWAGCQSWGIRSPGAINPSASASEILLGPYPGCAGGDPGHPGLCASATGTPRPGSGIPGGIATPTATSGPPWALTAAKSGSTCGTPTANVRATLGLGSEGSPHLAFYDRDQRVRAELNLGADGEPKFTVRDQRSLQGKTELNDFSDSSQQSPRGGVVAGAVAVPRPARPKPFLPSGNAGELSMWASKDPTNTIIPPASGPERDIRPN